jgi:hypothetical protein
MFSAHWLACTVGANGHALLHTEAGQQSARFADHFDAKFAALCLRIYEQMLA